MAETNNLDLVNFREGKIGLGTSAPELTTAPLPPVPSLTWKAAPATPDDPLIIRNINGTVGLSLAANGKVGIGGVTPTTDTLEVSGSVKATGTLTLPANGLTVGGTQLVAAGGNVGIGTSTPTGAKLVVQDAAGAEVRINGNAGTYGLHLGADSNHPWIGSRTNHDLRIVTNGSEKLRVTADGKVGIGSNNPGAKLEVAGDINVTGAIVAPEGTLRDDGGGWVRTYGNTGWYSQTHGGGWYMADATWIRSYGSKSIYHDTGNLRTDGTLQVGANGSTLSVTRDGNFAYRTNALFASTAGRVGIGTAAPTDTLDVNGTARVTALRIGSQTAEAYFMRRSDFVVTRGELNTNNRAGGQLYDNFDFNYADVFPPFGFTMFNLMGFIANSSIILFGGDVDSNDTLWCRWQWRTDRVRVICANSENRGFATTNAASYITYLAIWRR
jgi:hypothetical protein